MSWNWIQDPPDSIEGYLQEAWSVTTPAGALNHGDFPSVVLPKRRKMWRVIPPNAAWDEYTTHKFKTKEHAMVAARFMKATDNWL
jgi:hypothetical protein